MAELAESPGARMPVEHDDDEDGSPTPATDEYDLDSLDDDADLDDPDQDEDDAPAPDAPASSDEDSPAGDGPQADQASDEAAAGQPKTAPSAPGAVPPAAGQPDPAEFTWRGAKREWRFAGSRVSPEGDVTIPKQHAEHLRQLLAEGVEHRVNFPRHASQVQQLQRELTEYRTRAEHVDQHPDVVMARTILEQLTALRDNPQALDSFLVNLETEGPRLFATAEAKRAEAERDHWKSIAERGGVQSVTPSASPAEITTEQLTADLPDALADVLEAPEFAALRGERGRLEKLFARTVDKCYGILDGPDPVPLADGTLLMPGQVVRNYEFMRDVLRGELEAHQAREAEQAKRLAEAKKALQANARKAGNGNAPPPAPHGGDAPTGGGQKIPLLPKKGDREAMEQWYALPIEVQEASLRQGIRAK